MPIKEGPILLLVEGERTRVNNYPFTDTSSAARAMAIALTAACTQLTHNFVNVGRYLRGYFQDMTSTPNMQLDQWVWRKP